MAVVMLISFAMLLIINACGVRQCWSVHMKHRQQHRSRVKAAPPSRPRALIGIALVFVVLFFDFAAGGVPEALRGLSGA
jgi:hypothetical protein